MCGIAGIAAISLSENLVAESDIRTHASAIAASRSRREWRLSGSERRVGLGHTRLSIVDLSGGAQPMTNEDETIWVSFNGEIFNFIELRATLCSRQGIVSAQAVTLK